MAHNPRILVITSAHDAVEAMKGIGVDTKGVEIMSAKAVCRAIRLEAVDSRAANILKQEMLARDGDAAIARDVYNLTEGTTDVLLFGTTVQFESLIEKLKGQPFGLKAVAQELADTFAKYDAPPVPIRWRSYELDISKRTQVMGILNVTPDSFSDGGQFFDHPTAIKHALEMVENGADIIDVGGESTRPGAESVTLDEEADRVIPVIKAIAGKVPVPISIDTYKPEVAERALDAGASMINDISGLSDPRMAALAAKSDVPVVIMHMKGTPKSMQQNPEYESLMGEISRFLRERSDAAVQAGVLSERVIVDPGIGFGKTFAHNMSVIKHLSELKSLGLPIMIGTSRKAFIGAALGVEPDDRVEGTASTVALAIANGAHLIRVHDVKEMTRVARMCDAVLGSE